MRIVIVSPRQDAATGNRVTAARFRRGLEGCGHRVALVETPLGGAALAEGVAAFRPELVVLLHAYRSGRPWLRLPQAAAIPCVVVLTGTDVHGGLEDPEQGPVIEALLRRAAALVTQNRLTAERLRRTRPELAGRLHILPPGIELGDAPYPLRRRHGIAGELRLFLCPAGLRPVKGLLELLSLFDPLADRHGTFRVAFCGPPLDEDYRRRFLAAVAARPWALYLGVIPPQAMAAALSDADVVLNNSLSEGLPNALVEAAALGRPILARDIPGNAAVVSDGFNGLLYRDAETFTRAAERLITEPALLKRLSRPDPDPERYRPRREAEALAAICRQALG